MVHLRPGDPGPAPSILLLPVVLLAVFLMPIGIAGTAIALPDISRELGDSPTGLQWVVNGYNVSIALATVLWGAVAGRLGYRRTFVIGVAVTLVGSALSAVAGGLPALDLARVVAGIGAAAIVTGGTALLSHAYSGARRAHAFALLGTTIGLGLAAGPSISGALVAVTGWRGVFAVTGLIAAVVLVATMLGALPGARTEATEGPRALLDLSPLRNRGFLAVALVPVAGSIGYVSILTYLPVALSAVAGLDAGSVGVLLLPLTLPVLVSPVVVTTLIHRVRRITPSTVIVVSLGLLVAGDLLLVLLSPSRPLGLLVIPMLLLGFGWGLPMGLIDAEALAAVPRQSAGAAAGVLNFLRLGSEAVAVGVYAVLMTALVVGMSDDPAAGRAAAAGGSGAASAYADAFHVMALVLAVATAVVAVVVVLLLRRGTRPPGADEPRQALVAVNGDARG